MRYKYLTKKDNVDVEFWACDDCRKWHNHLILTGVWRLVGKNPGDSITCDRCSGDGGEGDDKSDDT